MANIDNEGFVQVSAGLFPKSILLKVREICVPNPDFLLLPNLISSNNQDENLAYVPTLQYALHECEVGQVKPKCLEYINAISNCPLEDPEEIIGSTPGITWKALEHIQRFLRKNPAARRASSLLTFAYIS